MRILVTLALALLATSCASYVRTYPATARRPSKGVPVRTSVLAEVVRITSYSALPDAPTGAPCRPDTSVTIEELPGGEMYYLNVHSAWFAKTEFTVELTGNGLLKTVTLNSDPKILEMTQALSALAGTVLPYVAAPKALKGSGVGEAAVTANELHDKYCLRSRVRVLEYRKVPILP